MRNVTNDVLREWGIEESHVHHQPVTRYKKVSRVLDSGEQVTREMSFERDIEWDYGKGFFFAWGGKFYTMKPGEEKVLYRFLAEHCAEHMANYLMTRKYLSTRRDGEGGTYLYDNGILNNQVLKKQLLNRIIVGVEEWNERSDDDFDMMLARQFGSDGTLGEMGSEREDPADTLITKDEVDQTSPPPKSREREEVPPTDDPELKAAREEAEAYGIEFSAKESAESIKRKIIKAMA